METSDRLYWVETMCQIANPVLHALKNRELKQIMPAGHEDRSLYAPLEALGRTLTGIAPWLESGESVGREGELREAYAELARQSIEAGTDPESPDYMVFSYDYQPIVDAAFLAHAILRAPNELWFKLKPQVQQHVIEALRSTRTRKPGYNNWLLFSAMIECALYKMGSDWDPMRIDYALRQHEQWYKGDGVYGDGPNFHWDYYNSFVIQPMLVDILEAVGDQHADWNSLREPVLQRAVRYAGVLERMISPEGTFPAIGRSLVYRFGAFQHLSHMALREELPDEITPAQVRCALTAVIQRMIDMPGTFDQEGWLTMGFCGYQPELSESYISTGSLYLCSTVFLPLGLPAQAPFWHDEPKAWTSREVWSGGQIAIDHAIK
nr:DUF2264 domain-containing protein [Paenibacillus selenitireducens]